MSDITEDPLSFYANLRKPKEETQVEPTPEVAPEAPEQPKQETAYGYPVKTSKEAGPWAEKYFKENPLVAGMAWGGGQNGSDPNEPRSIVVNPDNLHMSDEQKKKGLYKIEAIRHKFHENDYEPTIEITPEQQKWRQTLGSYANDDKALRQSIVSRIAVGDEVPGATEHQKLEASKINDALERNLPVRRGDLTTEYNTPLKPEERDDYNAYKASLGERGNDQDYDLQGYWLKYVKGQPRLAKPAGEHFVDEFKKPNHPTFSDESVYHKTKDQYGYELQGGKWYGDSAYLPPETIRQNPEKMAQLRKYLEGPAEGGKVELLTTPPKASITQDPNEYYKSLRGGATPEEREAKKTAGEADESWFATLAQQPVDKPLPDELYYKVRADNNPANIKRYIELGLKPSDRQLELLYKKSAQEGIGEGIWNTVKKLPSVALETAAPVILGGETLLADVGGYAGELFNPFVWSGSVPAYYRDRLLSDIKSIPAARAQTGEDLGQIINKIREGGTELGDKILVKTGQRTEEQALDNFIRRAAFDADYNNYKRQNPSALGRFADITSLPAAAGAHAVDEAFKALGPSIDQILVDHPEFNGDRQKAKEFRDNTTLRLTNKAFEAWKNYENANPIDENVMAVAGLVGPGANPFSFGFEAATIGKKSFSNIAKGLREAGKTEQEINAMYEAAKAEKLAKDAKELEKLQKTPGWAKAAGKLADLQDKFADWATQQIAERPNLKLALPFAAGAAGGGLVGYVTNPEHPLEGALSDIIKTEGAVLGWKLPRVAAEIGEAKALSAGGVKGIAETAATKPDASWATKLLLSPEIKGVKVPPKTWDWIGDNIHEWGRAGVDILPMTVAMGVLNSSDSDEIAKSYAQGLLFVGGHKIIQRMFTGDPMSAERLRLKQDRDIQKSMQLVSPETRQTMDFISDWSHVVMQNRQAVFDANAKLQKTIAEKGQDSPEAKQAAEVLQNRENILRAVHSASAATRIEFNRQLKLALANGNEILNGSQRAGQENVGIEVLSGNQIADRFIKNNPQIPKERVNEVRNLIVQEMAQGRGVTFEKGAGIKLPAGADPALFGGADHLVFDQFKPTAVVNADNIGMRQMLLGESATDALNHEIGHLLYKNQQYREALAPAEAILFATEFRKADGTVDKISPGILSENDLYDMYYNRYMKGRTPEVQRALAQSARIWNDQTQTLDRQKTINYIKEEVLADLASNTLRKQLIPGKGGMINHLMNWAAVRAKSNMVANAIHNVIGRGGEDPSGSIVSPALKLKFDPELIAANERAIKAMRDLNGAVAFSMEPDSQPKMNRAQMLSDQSLLNRYGKDSGLVKTQMTAIITDKNGNTIGAPILINNPAAAAGSWVVGPDGKLNQSRGYGQVPDEVKIGSLPPGSHIHVDSQVVYQADGKTPVLNTAKETKNIRRVRADVIRDALDSTPDVGTPNRFSAQSQDGLHFGGVFTPLQIQAIKNIPESIVPLAIKERLLAINALIAEGKGHMMDIDYSTHVDKNGRYVSTAPQIRTIVPMNIHLSKDGNFYVTTISHDRLLKKLELWGERMPARLALWGGSKEDFYKQFVREYLPNLPLKVNDVALDKDPEVSKQKKNIFNDFMNVVRNDTRHLNEDRTDIPLKRGEKNKDYNNVVRSFRFDAIMDMAPHNGEPLPINYKGLLENWLPAEAPTKEEAPGEAVPKFYSQLERTLSAKMPNRASAAQIQGILNSGGVKKDEIRFSGILSQLPILEKKYPGGIPKEEITKFLQEEGAVRFKDVTFEDRPAELINRIQGLDSELGEKGKEYAQNALKFKELTGIDIDGFTTKWNTETDTITPPEKDSSEITNPEALRFLKNAEKALEEYRDMWRQNRELSFQTKPTKYGETSGYNVTVPGGTNYKEVVLTIPESTKALSAFAKYEDELIKKYNARKPSDLRGLLTEEEHNRYLSLSADALKEKETRNKTSFTSSHFKDTPGYVAHIRYDDRADSSGEEGVFIQEMQNDRAKAAREMGGYADEKTPWESLQEQGYYVDEEDGIWRGFDRNGDPISDGAVTEQEAIDQIVAADIEPTAFTSRESKITEAPFSDPNKYTVALFKRALADAIARGKKWVGWTNGDTQADRYNLQKRLNKITYHKVNNTDYIVETEDNDGKVSELVAGDDIGYIERVAGKEIARRIANNEGVKNTYGEMVLSGDDLTIGGEWTKNLYDRTAVSAIGDYVKKLGGGKVEKGSIEKPIGSITQQGDKWVVYTPKGRIKFNNEEDAQKYVDMLTIEPTPMWKVRITPEMEKVVREGGQPNFLPKEEEKPERIENATYTDLKTGKVKEGSTHLIANPRAPQDEIDREGPAYGFRTSKGRIVDRKEAFQIASAAGQLKKPQDENQKFHYDRGVLHSGMYEGGRFTMPTKIVEKNRPVALQKAAQALIQEKTPEGQARLKEQYDALAKIEAPMQDLPDVPRPMSVKAMRDAIAGTVRKAKVGIANAILKTGDLVGSRIDIKAFEDFGQYVTTLHKPRSNETAGGAGEPIAHEGTVHLKNVRFGTNATESLEIAAGRSKGTIATMEGQWQKTSPQEAYKAAQKYLDDPEWSQLGMNPLRGSQYMIRSTGEPVTSADEVIQIGKFVLAKNAKVATPEELNQRTKTAYGARFLPSDDAHRKAIESGDMEEAQMLVDEAAKKAGSKTTHFYHSTDSDFYEFKPQGSPSSIIPDAYFFYEDRSDAEAHGAGKIIKVYLKYENPLVIDGKDKKAQMIMDKLEEAPMGQSVRNLIGDHDAVIIKNEQSSEYAVFDSSQIKSAEPATYDDNGNLIPLSQRFNPESQDIRYLPAEKEEEVKPGEIPTVTANKYSNISFIPSLDKDKGYSDQLSIRFPQGPKTLTYFSGGGLMEAGLRGLIDPRYAVEYDPQIAAAYRAAHGDHILEADITQVDPSRFKGIEYFHASPVCKNFSALKAKSQGGVESDLDIQSAEAVARVLDQHTPKFFTIENVKDYRGSEAYNKIKSKLTELGYKFDEGVYNAYDFGAPTDRKRLLLRAVREGELPLVRKVPGKSWYEVVYDLIDDLPTDTIRGKKDPSTNYLYEYLRNEGIDPMNVPEPILFPGGSLRGVFDYRLSNEPAFTFKATPAAVDRILLPGGIIKRVTGRAKARMSGLPDSFVLPTNENLAIKIIGNGVPPDLVRNVFGPMFEETKKGGISFIPAEKLTSEELQILRESDPLAFNEEEGSIGTVMAVQIAKKLVSAEDFQKKVKEKEFENEGMGSGVGVENLDKAFSVEMAAREILWEAQGKMNFLPDQKTDQEYMDAYAKNDDYTKQMIIENAADKAGYKIRGFKAMIGDVPFMGGNDEHPVTFMAQDKQVAGIFAEKGKPIREVATNASNLFDYRNPEHIAGLENHLREYGVDRWNDEHHAVVEGGATSAKDRYMYDSIDHVIEFAKEGNWGVLEMPSVKKYIAEQGHDGFYVNEEMQNRTGKEPNIAVFDPAKIKSIEPETHSLSGQVIPPSKRFDTTQKSINFLPKEEEKQDHVELATSLPTSKNANIDPAVDKRSISLDLIPDGDEFWDKLANKISGYEALQKFADLPTKEKVQELKDFAVKNYLFLHDQMDAELRNRAKLWYDGAYRVSKAWGEKYGVRPEAIAGVIACLSPQRDWFQNVSMAERVLDIWKNGDSMKWTPEMKQRSATLFKQSNPDHVALQKAIEGKDYKDLSNVVERAAWVRLHDAAHNEKYYRILSPEGEFLDYQTNTDGGKKAIQWCGFSTIAKTLRILEDPNNNAILSKQLGAAHKVRSFYNNIIAPNSKRGEVTSDTHNVAAGLMLPLGGSAPEVAANLSGPPEQSELGVYGTYPIYADAVREAAAQRGLLPREMQSITWEAIRSLFENKSANQVAKTREIWSNYGKGKITHDEAIKQIVESAGGFGKLDWGESSNGMAPESGGTSYSRPIPEI
jgi:site-specific DNA-cytosine methylase